MDTYAKGRLLKRGRIWHLDYFADNKRVRESARTTNKTVAERLLAHKLSQIDAGTYVHIEKAKKMGFADFVARYLEQYSNGHATWLKSKRDIFKLQIAFFCNRPIASITPQTIVDFRAWRMKQPIKNGTTQKLPQPSTVNRSLSTLSTLLNKAVSEGLLVSNPCLKVKQLKFSERGRERKRFLEQDEINRLLKAADYPLRQIITIAVYTGMRRGEVERLRWNDVTIRDDEGFITLTNTKNGEPRTVLMTQTVRAAFLAVKKRSGTDLIFPGKSGSRPWDFRKPFAEAVEKAGLNVPGKEKLVFHHLRHTFCSQLGLLGYDVKTIMDLSGHKSYEMALRYTKLNAEHRQKALERLEAKISAKVRTQHVTTDVTMAAGGAFEMTENKVLNNDGPVAQSVRAADS